MLNLILGVFSGIMFFQLEDDGPNVFFDRCVCVCVYVCVCAHMHRQDFEQGSLCCVI